MQTLMLLHSDAFPIGRYSEALKGEAISHQRFETLEGIGPDGGSLRVILMGRNDPDGERGPFDRQTAIIGLGLEEQPRFLSEEDVYLNLPENPSTPVLLSGVKRAYQALYQKRRGDQLDHQLTERTRELQEVIKIGAALSTVRDHSVLLTMILTKARELSRADAGSLYLLDEIEGTGDVLRWKLAQNSSIDVDFEEKVLPITRRSLAGYVAMTGETLVINDAYDLPVGTEYTINRSFDEENGYLTKSLLVFPMTNHAGDTIGVLQLINRKKATSTARLSAETVPQEVIPFDQDIVDIMRALSGQAAIAVENNLLYESIERLFEGFVTAAVTAIEQRDPTTSGHSFRVADLTVELARVVDRIADGKWRDVHFTSDQFREIRYASLLHDFGKVGVREQVLVKEKKLYPLQLDSIRARFDFVMKSVEAEASKKKLDYILQYGREGYDEFAKRVDGEASEQLAKLNGDLAFITRSNEPTVLPEGDFQYLQELSAKEFQDLRGDRRLLITADEAKVLSIRKGNLDSHERGEIESHVTHTFNFLQKIPWTKDLTGVPHIAFAHHEKLNGRGYPRKLSASEIPVQSRMMTVSDIYDALTATDRPYKRAVTTDRALDILNMEVNDGLLDGSLVEVFKESKVYERAGVVRA